jgi:hypothetical protein
MLAGYTDRVPMPTQADLDATIVYASIMEEAKFRALSINTFTGSGYALPVPLQHRGMKSSRLRSMAYRILQI